MRTLCAILCVRNEAAYLPTTLTHLARQGVDAFVIDHGSTDETPAIIERFHGRPVIGRGTMPWRGVFSLSEQMKAKQAVADRLSHDWLLHMDADEFPHSRAAGESLSALAARAQAAGATVVNFEEFVFLPRPHEAFEGRDFVAGMDRYYYFAPRPKRLMRLWRNGQGLSVAGRGGHYVSGDGVRLFDEPQVLRHYPVLSEAHARAKYVGRPFDPQEVAAGYHRNRLKITPEAVRFPAEAPALRVLPHQDAPFDRSAPQARHYWHWPANSSRNGAVADGEGARAYYAGLNTELLNRVPQSAQRVLEVGCGAGRLGAAVRARTGAEVIGVEREPDAVAAARQRLDRVVRADLSRSFPRLTPGSFDCVLFGDVLEHLDDPVMALRWAWQLLKPDGVVLASIPNVAHASVVRDLLRGDFQYHDSGLLDRDHSHLFSYATVQKTFLEAGLWVEKLDQTNTPDRDGSLARLIAALEPALAETGAATERLPDTAGHHLAAYQFLVQARKMPFAERDRHSSMTVITPKEPQEPSITFVVAANDRAQLRNNFLRSPFLDAAPARYPVFMRYGVSSAAALFNAVLAKARTPWVVWVHQDVYLPSYWPARFLDQIVAAEAQGHSPDVAGVFGARTGARGRIDIGRVQDGQGCFAGHASLPAAADTLDEVLLAVRRDAGLRFDPALGWHSYGADISLASEAAGHPPLVVDAPLYHNTIGNRRQANLPAAFHESRRHLARKWRHRLPVDTPCGRLTEPERG
ncbi:methyltransferase domain-containing protein [Yunchengibacter salinarum]|uniref:methyltransferase domain-containing protein n=1 Tax=Yunchengibacter salinarum TaxID=3133399 RepID=UPI0035B67287